MKQLRINLVSESAFSVGGHGVDTAFREDMKLLEGLPQVKLTRNNWRAADVQHAHTLGLLAVCQLLRARRRSAITAHITPGCLRGSLIGDRHWERAFLRYAVMCYNLAGIVVAVNQDSAAELRNLGVRRPIIVIPNSVDPDQIRSAVPARQEARQRHQIPANATVVLCVGQLQPRKGLETFIRCAATLPDVLFYWVGGQIFGPGTASYLSIKRIVSRPPHNVRFVGQLPRSAVFEYMSSANLFFLPSLHENCPLAALEAAAVGLPLLLRNLRQYSDLFGTACLYGNDETFPLLIRQCLSDETLSAELSERSLRTVEQFDSRAKSSRLLPMYERLSKGLIHR